MRQPHRCPGKIPPCLFLPTVPQLKPAGPCKMRPDHNQKDHGEKPHDLLHGVAEINPIADSQICLRCVRTASILKCREPRRQTPSR